MTGSFKTLQSSAHVLALIEKIERSRKYVWTAGRIITETALKSRFAQMDWKERKATLKGLTKTLDELSAQGFLVRRPLRQGIGYGSEVAFDYIRPLKKKPDVDGDTDTG